MKDMLSDAVAKKLNATLESVGGVRALYGDPISFNGEEIIPVARISITLGAMQRVPAAATAAPRRA